jgi:hypothetical protein
MRRKFRKSLEYKAYLGRVRKRRIRRDFVYFMAPLIASTAFAMVIAPNTDLLAAAFRDPRSMLDDRSPGDRDIGALYDTKPQLEKFFPKERVLPMTRERRLFDLPPEEPEAEIADFGIPTGAPQAVGFLAPPPPPPQLGQLAPVVGAPSLPGAVPEPETWLMNILGLFAVAGAMRYRRRKAGQSALPVNL